MSYVDKNLIQGESVVYRSSLAPLPYGWVVPPAVLAIAAAVFRNYFPVGHRWLAAGILAAVAVIVWLWARIRVHSAEFAVTNRRVMIKLGVLQRRTVETMLSKVEGVAVHQDLTGRILQLWNDHGHGHRRHTRVVREHCRPPRVSASDPESARPDGR